MEPNKQVTIALKRHGYMTNDKIEDLKALLKQQALYDKEREEYNEVAWYFQEEIIHEKVEMIRAIINILKDSSPFEIWPRPIIVIGDD